MKNHYDFATSSKQAEAVVVDTISFKFHEFDSCVVKILLQKLHQSLSNRIQIIPI
ncbi:unnamed protein product [Paramecium sonneborni]|uniref:Uncharacterized protein n=1 Tax=Paramecium sonneborni TaxID=65129 RepID=A0A8S1NUN9_9CILI|nr:unnamed protein product [Paramecium sonneborni]